MSAKFPQLAAAPPSTSNYQFAHFLTHPGDPITRHIVEFPRLSAVVQDFLYRHTNERTRDDVALYLALIGAPGNGKSQGAKVAALKAGFSVANVRMSDLASEYENGAAQALNAMLEEFQRWSAEHHRLIVVILDDFELSTVAKSENVAVTAGRAVLLNRLQELNDNRHLTRQHGGANLPFIVTMNNNTDLLPSLFRVGRAIHHDHVPTAEDKRNVAWAVLAPQTSEERHLVALLARRFAGSQPVAFWKALRGEMEAAYIRFLMAKGMTRADAQAKANSERMPLIPRLAWACARRLRVNRVRNYHTKRGFLSRVFRRPQS